LSKFYKNFESEINIEKLINDHKINDVFKLNNYNMKESVEYLIAELDLLKRIDPNSFRFQIPSNLEINNKQKIIGEVFRIDGKMIRFYENEAMEIVLRNKTKIVVYPDAFTICSYLNHDIKQVFYLFKKDLPRWNCVVLL
jgi:hypothetical protein